jgi:hypothetical protein
LKKDFPAGGLAWQIERMPKKAPKRTKAATLPRKTKKTEKRDFSQIALAVAERATGGTLKP